MKRILPSLPFFLLLLSFSLCAQTENTAESSYTEYFKLPRETIFLHLNKTTYLSGEEVWFKGYAYDQKNQLTSKATTNFNVGIYDSDGKEVKRALFRGENGFTKGNLLIDSTFVSGTYYIKASTNWMKNFQDDGAYIQKIEIFGDKIIGTNDENDAKNKYDFQFLPEGGHMVANTKNNIGFKVIDANGKGIAATGSIFNENNEEVTKFKSNSLGLGKFLFQPKLNQKYTSKITLASGETIEQEIQISKGQGITIIMNNLFPDRTIITLNTNAKTLENNSNATYKLLIHQSGKLKTVNFTFDQGTSKTITIPKKELFKGINTVTLFDENEQPILERLFFNALDMKKASVSVSKLTTVNDSIILSVKELNLASDANISISILPEETESYAPNNNIISSFVLKPYLKGFVENPEYYFAKLDRKHQYELDILLLTQGWSKYNWDAIFKNPPKQNHRFENGITIKGKVNSPASGIDKLFLYATKNHQAQFIPLNEDQSFTLRNLYLEKGERVRFSYTDKSGIFKKPSMYISFNITDKEDNISTSISNEKSTNIPSSSLETFSSKDFFYEDLEELETITIEGKRTKKETDAVAIRGTYKKVTVNEFSRFPYVLDYIRNNGYNVSEDTGIANRTGEVTITDRNRLSFGAKTSPLVFLDDMPLTSFNILYNYSMANVEKILIDRSGFGYGLRSAGGVIKIYTRTTALYQDEKGRASISNTSIAPFSFQKAKEYYAPKYSSYTNSSFRKYGVISWIPELVLNKNETTTFKVFNTRTKRAIVFIEGITKDGNLISQKQIIDLSKNKL